MPMLPERSNARGESQFADITRAIAGGKSRFRQMRNGRTVSVKTSCEGGEHAVGAAPYEAVWPASPKHVLRSRISSTIATWGYLKQANKLSHLPPKVPHILYQVMLAYVGASEYLIYNPPRS